MSVSKNKGTPEWMVKIMDGVLGFSWPSKVDVISPYWTPTSLTGFLGPNLVAPTDHQLTLGELLHQLWWVVFIFNLETCSMRKSSKIGIMFL